VTDRERLDYLERSHCWIRHEKNRWKVGAPEATGAFASGGTIRDGLDAAMKLRAFRAEPAAKGGAGARAKAPARPRKVKAAEPAGTTSS
jgi:hypothetical protein